MTIDLHYQSLSFVRQRIAAGDLTSLQVVKHQLGRIESLDPKLRSFARVLAEDALDVAADLDRDRRSGKPPGPLHGIPLILKDVFFTKGVVTASGTKVMSDHVPTKDATVVARLREAGAILIGKAQLTEAATIAYHPDITPAINPWNADYYTGVSSSGAAVAVAAGMAYGALATDTGGSIRFPAACCGLVGFKPTFGRVSCHGVFPQAPSLDHVGTLTRTVEDAALILNVVAGHDPEDPTTLRHPIFDLARDLPRDLRGFRVGIDWAYASDGVEDDIVALMRTTVKVMRNLGATIRELSVPAEYQTLAAAWIETCGRECAESHRDYFPARASEYGPVLAAHIEAGLRVTDARYQEIEHIRSRFRAKFDRLAEQVDALLCPSMPYGPPTLEKIEKIRGGGYTRTSPLTFTAPYNFSGHPTLVVPVGMREDGMPATIQLIGSILGEHALLKVGHAIEKEAGFRGHPAP